MDERPESESEREPLRGRVAIVTGASRGIGRAIALRLAEEGATVAAVARSTLELEDLAASRECIVALPGDVASEADVARVAAAAEAITGRVDILVNNAGIGVFGPLEETSWDDFDRVLRVNVGGTFLGCRAVLPAMRRQGSGEIINVASVVAVKGYPNQAVYGASKHAVLGLTKALAAELHGTGIRVRAVCPGGVDTDLVRDARPDLDTSALMRPEEIADVVAYLLLAPSGATIDQVNVRRTSGSPWF